MPLKVNKVNIEVKDPQSNQMVPAGLLGSDALSVIDQAKTQAVTEIEQKGTQTKESIPDDYSALSGEVSNLKDSLNEIVGTGTNMFDKDNVNYVEAYILGNQGELGTLSSNANAKTVYIPCEPNTTYTISKQQATARFAVAYTNTLPTVGGTVYGITAYASNTSITITTGNNAEYLVAFIYLSTADTLTFEQICAMIQIQTGPTATEYEPYKMTAVDDVARAGVTALEASDAQAGKFKQIQATAVPMAANIGSALEFDISAMTGSGNASYTDGKWVFALGGTITGNIANIVANKKYIIELATEVQAGIDGDINTNPCTVTLADVSITFFSAADANWIIALTPTVSGTVALTVAMHENWNGKISAITVKPVNAVAGIPQKINSIPLHANANSLSFGGQNNLLLYGGSGALNTSLGVNAQRDIDTGLWNTAFGYNTQLVLTQGKGNNAFGCFAQGVLKTGCYNNAFGESSQNHLVDGQWNDGFGIETQGMATSAKNNVAFGRRSQHLLETGNFNTAIGSWSGFNYHGSSPEGKWAVKTSSYTTLIGGASTLKGADTGDSDYATALGYQSRSNKQGLALGAMAEADNGGIAIGYNAKAGQDEVVIGNRKIIFNQDGTVTWVAVT